MWPEEHVPRPGSRRRRRVPGSHRPVGARACPTHLRARSTPASFSRRRDAGWGVTLTTLVLARQAAAGSESGRPAPPPCCCTPTGGARPGTREPRWVSGAAGGAGPRAPCTPSTAGPAGSAVLGGGRSNPGAPEGPGEKEKAPEALTSAVAFPPGPGSSSPVPGGARGGRAAGHPSGRPCSRSGFPRSRAASSSWAPSLPVCRTAFRGRPRACPPGPRSHGYVGKRQTAPDVPALRDAPGSGPPCRCRVTRLLSVRRHGAPVPPAFVPLPRE